MQKQQKILLATILSGLVLFGGVSIYLVTLNPFTTSESSFNVTPGSELEPGAQRLSFHIDADQNRHFVYLLGVRPNVEPDNIANYTGTHVLKYGVLIDGEFQAENVTDELVFPYHYNFKIDSTGQIHLAYIKDNYTLYYTVRNPTTGIWTTSQLSTPSEMWALMPTIVLGTDELPRIVYSVTFKEDGDLFFDQEGFEIKNLSSLFYAVFNGTSWSYYDLADNHSTNSFIQKDITIQRIYNPGIIIEDGFAYIAFTNKVSLSVETRLQYLKIHEIPEDTNFIAKTHQRAKIAPSQQATYRRPSIHTVGDGVLIAFGAWAFGAGSVIMLENSSAIQNTNPAFAADQWIKENLLPPNKLNKQLDSIVGVKTDNGTIYITWSLYDLFNAETLQYAHDVFLATLRPFGNNIGFNWETDVQRVTDTTQIHHYSPSMQVFGENTVEIHYIELTDEGQYLLKTSTFGGIVKAFDDEGLALVTSLGLIGIFISGSVAVIRLIPRPEEKIVILPHMINLRDVISDD